MKKYTLSLIISLVLVQSWGQDSRALQERIESQRIAFITERLDLSVEEAQQFWPIYNQYRKKEKELNEQKKPQEGIALMNDLEVEEFIEQTLKVEQALLSLQTEFVGELQAVISARKVLRLWQAERAFKERLVQMLRRRNSSNR